MMSGQRRAFCAMLLLACLAPAARAQNSQPAPEAQDAAAVPAAPPKVTCQGGQLSIAAKGSTLTSILAAVRDCIGAKVDFPPSASASRFFDTLGPGPVRQVLASLLDATDFNYVIGASDSDPDKVQTILLIARSDSKGQQPAADDRDLTANRRAFQQMRQSYLNAGVPDDLKELASPSDFNAPVASEANTDQTAPADQAPAQNPSDTSPNSNQNAESPAEAPTQPQVQPTTQPPVQSAEPSAQPSTPPSGVDDQIKNMEQLFQLRQQMIANQTKQGNQTQK